MAARGPVDVASHVGPRGTPGAPAPGPRPIEMRESEGGVTLRVRVQPRASREGLAGEREGALVVRLSAPPVEGQANAALSRVLARAFGVPPSHVQLLRGERGRDKLVRVDGLALADARARLEDQP